MGTLREMDGKSVALHLKEDVKVVQAELLAVRGLMHESTALREKDLDVLQMELLFL